MVEVLLEYALFLAQAVTVVVAVGAIALIIAVAARKGGQSGDGIRVQRLNEHFDELSESLEAAALPPKTLKGEIKARKKARKAALRGVLSQRVAQGRLLVLM